MMYVASSLPSLPLFVIVCNDCLRPGGAAGTQPGHGVLSAGAGAALCPREMRDCHYFLLRTSTVPLFLIVTKGPRVQGGLIDSTEHEWTEERGK